MGMHSTLNAEAQDAAPSPVRILVQTQTHLVPGESGTEKEETVERSIRKNVLKNKYSKRNDRLYLYNDYFAVPGYHCFFLYDHALSPVGDDVTDDEIPLLWYRWSGKEL